MTETDNIATILSEETYHPLFREYIKLTDSGGLSLGLIGRIREIILSGIDCINKDYAALFLLDLYDEEDRKKVLPTIRKVAKNAKHPYQFHAAIKLLSSNLDDIQTVFPIIRSIAEDDNHPDQLYATETILREGNARDKKTALDRIRSIAKDDNHPNQFDAAINLWEQRDVRDEKIVLPIMRKVATNATHPNQFDAAHILLRESHSDDRKIGLTAFRAIAQDDPGSFRGKSYLRKFKYSGDEEDHRIARDCIYRIFTENLSEDESERIELIDILRESKNPLNQELGTQLMQSYYPAV